MLRSVAISVRASKTRFSTKSRSRKLHTTNEMFQAFTRGGSSAGSGFQPRSGSYAQNYARPKAPQQQSQPSVMDQEENRDEERTEGTVVNDSEDYQDDSGQQQQQQYSSFKDSKYGDQAGSKARGPPAPLLAIYRPNRDSVKGSAAQFSFAANRKSAYLSMAKQQGEKTAPGSSDRQFNWDNKLVFKLDAPGASRFTVRNFLFIFTIYVPFETRHVQDSEYFGRKDSGTRYFAPFRRRQSAAGSSYFWTTPQNQNHPLLISLVVLISQRYTTLKMKPAQNGNGFYLNLLRSEGEQKQMISILIDDTDSRTLQIFLAESIRLSLGFKG
jgi:hypothetical protein